MTDAATFFHDVAEVLERAAAQPYGPPVSDGENEAVSSRKVAGRACVELCGGNADRARALWKQIARDLDGYMPNAAAVALIRAANAQRIVVPDEAPEVL